MIRRETPGTGESSDDCTGKEEWIACRCKCARSDLFTSEELQFKKDAIQTVDEAKKNFPASASNNKEARQWYRISLSFLNAPKTRNDPGDFWEPLFTVKALECMISQELMTLIL
jgi:hypothetical protein